MHSARVAVRPRAVGRKLQSVLFICHRVVCKGCEGEAWRMAIYRLGETAWAAGTYKRG